MKKKIVCNQPKNTKTFPFVSICMPTFNRRPFIPFIIKCFENQTYPKDRMEWIVIDDGTDKIEDLLKDIPQVKYFKYDEKMVLGKKRNLAHEKSIGDIIVYMDDDDYYPPERVSHAVETLQNHPEVLCVGSSEMFIYFKHIDKMYKFGPYGPNHSTAATMAFRKELLLQTRYDDNAALAEEKQFLKNYTVPFFQLDSMKTILVFSHNHNSFDKKTLLEPKNLNQFVNISEKKVTDFIKEENIYQFFMKDIDLLLENYEPGRPEHKPDVIKQTNEMHVKREKMMEQQKRNMLNYQQMICKYSEESKNQGNKELDMNFIVSNLVNENSELKEKVAYLEKKIKELINIQIEKERNRLIDLAKNN
jgi:glycosyltransferase involved in cell wall biosynthesis